MVNKSSSFPIPLLPSGPLALLDPMLGFLGMLMLTVALRLLVPLALINRLLGLSVDSGLSNDKIIINCRILFQPVMKELWG
jgi:hypothetical protein